MVSFPDVAAMAFGSHGRWLAGVLAYVDLFAMGVGCMIVTARSLDAVAQAVLANTTSSLLTPSSALVVTALAYLPMCFLRDLRLLSYLSVSGLLAIVAIVALVLHLASDLVAEDAASMGYSGGYPISSTSSGRIPWVDAFQARAARHTEAVGPQPFLPMSIVLYQFSLHSLFPSLRASMASPHKAAGMATVVLCTLAVAVGGFAAVCYAVFEGGMTDQVTAELGGGAAGLLANG